MPDIVYEQAIQCTDCQTYRDLSAQVCHMCTEIRLEAIAQKIALWEWMKLTSTGILVGLGIGLPLVYLHNRLRAHGSDKPPKSL